MNRRTRSGVVVASLAALATLLIATPALGQVTPSPKAAGAGLVETINFTVAKGCSGSPTVKVTVRIPPRVTTPTPMPPKGWTYTYADNVVTFTGGPQDPTKPLSLGIQVTMPDDVGATMFFPVEQFCQKGSIKWTGVPTEAKPTPANPAPQVLLTDGVPDPEVAETGEPPSDGKSSNALFGIGGLVVALGFLVLGGYLLLRRSERGD